MGMGGGGGGGSSFSFNDQQALALNQQNSQQLQNYQLQRQGLLGQSNAAQADYFNRTNNLAQDSQLRDMSYYTNALGGYQNSLNKNTADANSLMQTQNGYYNQVLQGQQQYQNQFAGLLGSYNQQQAAQNAAYQQQYLSGLGQYNQDNTAQQQQFMQSYLGQMAGNSNQLQQNQQNYQNMFSGIQGGLTDLMNQNAARQAALQQQAQQQSLSGLLNQWGRKDPKLAAMGNDPRLYQKAQLMQQGLQ
jgi:hypothetical protein